MTSQRSLVARCNPSTPLRPLHREAGLFEAIADVASGIGVVLDQETLHGLLIVRRVYGRSSLRYSSRSLLRHAGGGWFMGQAIEALVVGQVIVTAFAIVLSAGPALAGERETHGRAEART